MLLHLNLPKFIFPSHDIPEVMLDNGSQFSGQGFCSFMTLYGFHCITSSPRFPQSYSEAERADNDKSFWEKQTYLFIEPYLSRMVTVQLTFSWAEVYGLQCQLFPFHCQAAKSCLTRKGRRGCKTANYNRCHQTKTLCDLSTGVWVSDAKTPCTVIQNHSTPPKSYKVDCSHVIARYNRLHLIPLQTPSQDPCDWVPVAPQQQVEESECQSSCQHHLLQHLHYHQ